MATTAFQVRVRGIPESPTITEINVRAGANTSYAMLFKAAVGLGGLIVLEVRSDEQNGNFQGKVYQWLRVGFADGREGWVRDDLVDVVGDGSRFGYGVLTQPVIAFSLTRDTSKGVLAPGQEIGNAQTPAPSVSVAAPATAAAPAPLIPAVPVAPVTAAPVPAAAPTTTTTAAPAPAPSPAGASDLTRVRHAAFNITAAFEGGGYATYQTYDSGIISYGRFQFTLAAGSFITVVTRFSQRATGATADGLRNYLPTLNTKSESLRQDGALKALCVEAAKDPIMQAVQDEVATEGYWDTVVELSIVPRNIQTPLGYALLFDMSIQHGRFNFLVPKAEEELGVPNKSRLGENGITEQTYIAKLAQLRQENLYNLAAKMNLPGLKPRGDFWVNLVNTGDWYLQGNADGNLNINGKIVQVKNP